MIFCKVCKKEIKAGESAVFKILVKNRGTLKVKILFRLEGEKKEWGAVDTERIEIEAGEGKEIEITISVPSDVKEGDYKLKIIAYLESDDTVKDKWEFTVSVKVEEEEEKEDDGFPGFEAFLLFVAVGVAFVIRRQRFR